MTLVSHKFKWMSEDTHFLLLGYRSIFLADSLTIPDKANIDT